MVAIGGGAGSKRLHTIGTQPIQKVLCEKETLQVMMTRDRLELQFRDVWDSAANSSYRNTQRWGSVFLALLLARLPADFQDFFFLSGGAWQVLLTACLLGSLALTLKYGYEEFMAKKKYASPEEAVNSVVAGMHDPASPPNDAA